MAPPLGPLVGRPLARSAARHLASRRLQSSVAGKSADAARDAAGKAKHYQALAQQGLSRVTTAAGPAVASAAKNVTAALGKVGGRTGKLIAFAERQTPFVVYYGKVALELGKLVFNGQKMSLPSMATFQTFYRNLWQSIQRRSALPSPQSLLERARALNSTQLMAGGVVAAECLGFFTVGEMLGRFKLVGYHGNVARHH